MRQIGSLTKFARQTYNTTAEFLAIPAPFGKTARDCGIRHETCGLRLVVCVARRPSLQDKFNTMFSPFRPCGPSRSARSRTARSRVLAVLPLLALSGALLVPRVAQAQTVVSPVSGSMAGTVGVVPAGPSTRVGAVTVVAAAIDTSGDADVAKRALGYANEALKATPGYSPMPSSEYAPLSEKLAKEATKTDWGWPFTASDYQKIGKLSKAPSAMTISVTPVAGGYDAVAEMYDTKRGALVGYGKDGATGEDALQTAIGRAVTKLGQTATLSGIIISKPNGYLARLSLGSISGARGGARVEYLDGAGNPVAFGTIFDIAPGESLATVAPETAHPELVVNGRVRIVNNPTEKRALPNFTQLSDKEFNDFQKEFGVALAVSAAVYFLAGGQ